MCFVLRESGSQCLARLREREKKRERERDKEREGERDGAKKGERETKREARSGLLVGARWGDAGFAHVRLVLPKLGLRRCAGTRRRPAGGLLRRVEGGKAYVPTPRPKAQAKPEGCLVKPFCLTLAMGPGIDKGMPLADSLVKHPGCLTLAVGPGIG